MEKLKGVAFDKAFAQHMVKDHKKDIAAYEKQARGTTKLRSMPMESCRPCGSTYRRRSFSERESSPLIEQSALADLAVTVLC